MKTKRNTEQDEKRSLDLNKLCEKTNKKEGTQVFFFDKPK